MSVPERLSGYRLNIGSVQNGWYNIDNRSVPGLDCLWDLEQVPWPLEDNSAIIAQMGHVVSRINPARWGMFILMDELWRILKPGAELCVITYYGTNSYFQGDPAACNSITELTWFHFDPEHRSGLWQHYQPLPWRMCDVSWSVDGNIQCVMAKR